MKTYFTRQIDDGITFEVVERKLSDGSAVYDVIARDTHAGTKIELAQPDDAAQAVAMAERLAAVVIAGA